MTTKNLLLALAATSLIAFGAAAPVYAEDPPPAADEGMKSDAPADPGAGDAPADPGTDQGGDAKGDSGDAPPAGDQGGEPK